MLYEGRQLLFRIIGLNPAQSSGFPFHRLSCLFRVQAFCLSLCVCTAPSMMELAGVPGATVIQKTAEGQNPHPQNQAQKEAKFGTGGSTWMGEGILSHWGVESLHTHHCTPMSWVAMVGTFM